MTKIRLWDPPLFIYEKSQHILLSSHSLPLNDQLNSLRSPTNLKKVPDLSLQLPGLWTLTHPHWASLPRFPRISHLQGKRPLISCPLMPPSPHPWFFVAPLTPLLLDACPLRHLQVLGSEHSPYSNRALPLLPQSLRTKALLAVNQEFQTQRSRWSKNKQKPVF